ncbi:hypothetical protein MMS54_28550, partial [Escherichia coli]
VSGRSPDQMAIVIASRVTVLQLHILSRKFPPFLGFLSVADRTRENSATGEDTSFLSGRLGSGTSG